MAIDLAAVEAWDNEGAYAGWEYPAPVPESNEWDWRGVINTVSSVANTVSGAVLAARASTAAYQQQQADREQERFLRTLQLDTTRTTAAAGAQVAKLQAQTELAKAQQTYRVAAGLPPLSGIISSVQPTRENAMLLIALAGLVIAWIQLRRSR